MAGGAPLGNNNAGKGKPWRQAIEQALERRTKCRTDGKKELDALADKLLDACMEGQLPALKEFADRIEGKSVQPLDIKGDINANVKYNVTGLKRGSG